MGSRIWPIGSPRATFSTRPAMMKVTPSAQRCSQSSANASRPNCRPTSAQVRKVHDVVEGEETDAQGEDKIKTTDGNAAKRCKATGKEVCVFEKTQHREVQHDCSGNERSVARRRELPRGEPVHQDR